MKLTLCFLLLLSSFCFAYDQHPFARTVAVFPIKSSVNNEALNYQSWIDFRKYLIDNSNFLVAAKNFLIQKEVYQARGQLKPADALVLGKILNAHLLITLEVKKRDLHIYVYNARTGFLAYSQTLNAPISIPIEKSLRDMTTETARSFLSNLPYKAFPTKLPNNKDFYTQNGELYEIRLDFGNFQNIDEDDIVEWISIDQETTTKLFQSDEKYQSLARGKVVRIEDRFATVELEPSSNISNLKASSTFQIYKPGFFKTKDTTHANSLVGEVKQSSTLDKNKKQTITAASILINLALFLSLAL